MYSNYNYYKLKTQELFEEREKRRRVKESKGNPKALSNALYRLNLSDGEYEDFSFKDIDTKGVVFVFCSLEGSDFSNSKLSDCDFTFASLKGCNFTDATLINCIFRHTNLKEVNFTGAKMLFCDFTGSNFHLLSKSS